MNVSNQELEMLEGFYKKISLEVSLLKDGSDEGLIPLYSLLNSLLEVSDLYPPAFCEDIRAHVAILDGLLDNAISFDSDSIAASKLLVTKFNTVLTVIKDPESSPSVSQSPATVDVGPESSDSFIVIGTQDPEILEEFQSESIEHLEIIENALLELEKNAADIESINSLFRSFHTIKGVSAFLHFPPIKDLSHEVESLLDLARNQTIQIDSGIISLILESKDRLQSLLSLIAEASKEGREPSRIIPVSDLILQVRNAADKALKGEFVTFEQQAETAGLRDEGLGESKTATKGTTSSETIRVSTTKLDSLLEAVGELIVVQSQLRENIPKAISQNSDFYNFMNQFRRVTKEIHETSMSLRMVPIKPNFQKANRVVRDLSKTLNKKINTIIEGEDTELDRTLVELVGDPLVHMVRNAVDHGLESPQERLDSGKDETGNCHIRATRQGEHVVIEIADDGKGINSKAILEKAREKQLVPEDKEFTDEEIYRFLLMPGFSTAETVTDVSGRGVGMDVVLKNIEKLRGIIEIDSTLGKGSTFKIKIPLTMAIIDGLIVQAESSRFILPADSAEIVLSYGDCSLSKIQGDVAVINHNNQLLPLFHLNERFNLINNHASTEESAIIIVDTAGQRYGLQVDAILGKQEIVVKSLGDCLSNIQGIAGGAVMGDGTVSLVIDPATLVNYKERLVA